MRHAAGLATSQPQAAARHLLPLHLGRHLGCEPPLVVLCKRWGGMRRLGKACAHSWREKATGRLCRQRLGRRGEGAESRGWGSTGAASAALTVATHVGLVLPRREHCVAAIAVSSKHEGGVDPAQAAGGGLPSEMG